MRSALESPVIEAGRTRSDKFSPIRYKIRKNKYSKQWLHIHQLLRDILETMEEQMYLEVDCQS